MIKNKVLVNNLFLNFSDIREDVVHYKNVLTKIEIIFV